MPVLATRYVSATIARVTDVQWVVSGKPSPDLILIYGDEVESDGDAGASVAVTFRGRRGSVKAGALAESPVLEVYFIDVGQGDSTFIVTPQRKKILIDGGINRQALGFLSWKYRLDEPGADVDIDLMAVTHADADHLNGLVEVLSEPRIKVRRVVHSGIATFRKGAFSTGLGDKVTVGGHSYLKTRHDDLAGLPSGGLLSDGFTAWQTALLSRSDLLYEAVDASSPLLDVGDAGVTLEVLGPRLVSVPGAGALLPWFADEPHTINGHSVVVRLTCGDARFLFAGDVNVAGSRNLLADPELAARLDAHVLKAPHHGSSEFAPAFLEAVRPQITVISSGDDRDHGHPRANFLGAIGRAMRSAQPLLFSTEIAANFKEVGEPPTPGLPRTLAAVDAGTDNAMAVYRKVFKKRLHGMINVRTDGEVLFAARRVAASYWWEAYGSMPVASR